MSCHCWACPSFKHKFHGHNFTVESLLAIFWLHSIMLLCWVELHCFGTVLGMGMLSLLLYVGITNKDRQSSTSKFVPQNIPIVQFDTTLAQSCAQPHGQLSKDKAKTPISIS